MSARRDFDGFLSDWLDEDAGTPRARPCSTSSWCRERRPASGRGGRASKGGSRCKRPFASRPLPRLGLIVLIALAIVAAVGIAVLAVGSRSPRVPPPFGPARNGAIMYAGTDNDLYALDPVSGVATRPGRRFGR